MKRIIATAALAVTTSLLCGCSNTLPFKQSAAFEEKNCIMNAQLECGDLNAKAQITRHGEGEWEFAFTEPAQLMGLVISLDGEGVSASLGGLSVEVEPSMVYNMLPQVIADAVDSLAELPEGSITEEDGVLTLKTDCGEGNVVVTAKKDSCELISLKCPFQRLAVYFSDFEELDESEEVRIIEE